MRYDEVIQMVLKHEGELVHLEAIANRDDQIGILGVLYDKHHRVSHFYVNDTVVGVDWYIQMAENYNVMPTVVPPMLSISWD